VEREISRISIDNPLHVVFVDYLNIMEPNFHSKDWFREQGCMAKDLKEVARKTGTILFTGAQLNTANMEVGAQVKTDDIKYSRAITENSDWVIGFNRNPDDIAMKQIRLDLAKHRFSASCTAAIEVDFETMQIIDMGRAEDLQPIGSTLADEKKSMQEARRSQYH
jgi:replicative DNA helicase